MDLPINEKELKTIINALGFGGDAALYHKLKVVLELKQLGLPINERYGVETQ